MITDFMAEDGSAMEGWVVNLGAATMLTSTFNDAVTASLFVRARPATDGDLYGDTSGTTGALVVEKACGTAGCLAATPARTPDRRGRDVFRRRPGCAQPTTTE